METICFRMSVREEHDFLKDYISWMKGPGLDQESLHVYNFGYDRPLPFPSIALTPNTTIRRDIQHSHWSSSYIALIGRELQSVEIFSCTERSYYRRQKSCAIKNQPVAKIPP